MNFENLEEHNTTIKNETGSKEIEYGPEVNQLELLNKVSLVESRAIELEADGKKLVDKLEKEILLPVAETKQIRDSLDLENGLQNIKNQAKTLLKKFKEKLTWVEQAKKQERRDEVIKLLGESLEITDLESKAVKKHLEHLGLLPDRLLSQMRYKGLKVIVGDKDVMALSDNEGFKSPPRGWNKKSDWSGIAGAYIRSKKIVIAGKGEAWSNSLTLHEYGHGVDHLVNSFNSKEVKLAHQRLYKKLSLYLQQDGPGGQAGAEELFAESIADFLIVSKKKFIKRYDEKWYGYINEFLNTYK